MELLILLLCIVYVSLVRPFIKGFINRWRERKAHQKIVDEGVQKALAMYDDRHIVRRYQREDRHSS